MTTKTETLVERCKLTEEEAEAIIYAVMRAGADIAKSTWDGEIKGPQYMGIWLVRAFAEAQLAKALWEVVGWIELNEGKEDGRSLANRLACELIDGGMLPGLERK